MDWLLVYNDTFCEKRVLHHNTATVYTHDQGSTQILNKQLNHHKNRRISSHFDAYTN